MKVSEVPETENAQRDARNTDTGAWPAQGTEQTPRVQRSVREETHCIR